MPDPAPISCRIDRHEINQPESDSGRFNRRVQTFDSRVQTMPQQRSFSLAANAGAKHAQE